MLFLNFNQLWHCTRGHSHIHTTPLGTSFRRYLQRLPPGSNLALRSRESPSFGICGGRGSNHGLSSSSSSGRSKSLLQTELHPISVTRYARHVGLVIKLLNI